VSTRVSPLVAAAAAAAAVVALQVHRDDRPQHLQLAHLPWRAVREPLRAGYEKPSICSSLSCTWGRGGPGGGVRVSDCGGSHVSAVCGAGDENYYYERARASEASEATQAASRASHHSVTSH
jgi:hypothetical protein